jgi:hypothetical protein
MRRNLSVLDAAACLSPGGPTEAGVAFWSES